MRILRVLLFVMLASFNTVGFAQNETKVIKYQTAVADPSPWEKEPETELWHLERDAPGGKWEMVMAVVGKTVHFTIMITCGNGYSEIYSWKRGATLALGKGCTGRKAGMSVRHLKDWIEPLPLEVQRIAHFKDVGVKR